MSTSSISAPKTDFVNAESVPVTNPHNLAAIYSNYVGGAATMLDFSLFFLEQGQIPGEDGTITKQEIKAIVTLPMPVAAALIQVLQRIMDGHQQALTLIAEQSAKAHAGQ